VKRREFLKSAGGLTCLALMPAGRGLFALADPPAGQRLPMFTALPYIQPGPGAASGETMVVAWQTQPGRAAFDVEFGVSDKYGSAAAVDHRPRIAGRLGNLETRSNWSAELSHLTPGKRYYYRVRGNEQTIAEGYFTTPQPRGRRIRFAAFGDNSYGDLSDRLIAYEVYQQHPDFVMNCGDNVYESGTDGEYQRVFFPIYNAGKTARDVGAPLLRSVPFYTVLANHDVMGRDLLGRPAADFARTPDALGYYTAMHLPLNGPSRPAKATPTIGPRDRIDSFRRTAGDRFPRMANYSFDWGDAHFLCLDSNLYVDPNDHGLRTWIADDLSNTDALWKFVTFHHPAFNVGLEHYDSQHMRVLAPVFEQHRVDLVLSGHEHNYQRTRPLRFAPKGPGQSGAVSERVRHVPGSFTVDRMFDGSSHTTPNGVLYVVTGAGGKQLYDAGFTDTPARWLRDPDNRAEYVARMVTDRYSFTLFDVDGARLTMTQIDANGRSFDRIVVTKSRR
jgi:hypothetical protein